MKKSTLSLFVLSALTQPAVAEIYDNFSSSSSSSDYSSALHDLITEFDFNLKTPALSLAERSWQRLAHCAFRAKPRAKIRSAAIDVGASSVLKTQFVSKGGQIALRLICKVPKTTS